MSLLLFVVVITVLQTTRLVKLYLTHFAQGRQNAPNKAILVTDGPSNQNSYMTLPNAQTLRNSNTEIIAVAVGSNVDQTEMEVKLYSSLIHFFCQMLAICLLFFGFTCNWLLLDIKACLLQKNIPFNPKRSKNINLPAFDRFNEKSIDLVFSDRNSAVSEDS